MIASAANAIIAYLIAIISVGICIASLRKVHRNRRSAFLWLWGITAAVALYMAYVYVETAHAGGSLPLPVGRTAILMLLGAFLVELVFDSGPSRL